MTYENPSTDTGTRSPTESGIDGEQTLYGEPRHEVHDDYDEQTLYGDPQHDSSGETDVWDVGLLFASTESEPIGSDELDSRNDSPAARPTQR